MDWVRAVSLAFCAAVLATAAHTQESPGLGAVGRIEKLESLTTCTAVLVEPDVVLTAAHCVEGDAADPEAMARVRFRPGVGLAGPVFDAAEIVLHPLYDRVNDPWLWRLRFDLAAVRLSGPVPPEVARPLGTGDEAQPGERLFLVSWRPDSGLVPRQRACEVVPGLRGLVTLGCRVSGGESGAPVLRKTSEGLEIVAILSSRGKIKEQPVAQGSNVALRLPPLLAALR